MEGQIQWKGRNPACRLVQFCHSSLSTQRAHGLQHLQHLALASSFRHLIVSNTLDRVSFTCLGTVLQVT